MAKRSEPRPLGPTIDRREGRRRLLSSLEKGKALLANRPLKESSLSLWGNAVIEHIKNTFGEDNGHLYTFNSIFQVSFVGPDYTYDQHAEKKDAETLKKGIEILQGLIDQINEEIDFEIPISTNGNTFWNDIHPHVISVAKERFDNGHYADAVEAAFKELNNHIKDLVKRKNGNEFDGADLMRRAFSPNSPIIALENLSTETGKNVQQGYMDIFAGAMTGIRNPKAHMNMTLESKEAIHLLYLASLLFFKLDKRH